MDKLGWFDLPGRPGDRTLQQQLQGLERLMENVKGKTVLDVGCAEGQITLACLDNGALLGHGIEIIPNHVVEANKYVKYWYDTKFEVADANDYRPKGQYDIVLLLAILHKLRNPTDAARRYARACKELCIIRLPPATAPTVVDERSGNVPHHIDDAMCLEGFVLKHVCKGPFDEWMGYYYRG